MVIQRYYKKKGIGYEPSSSTYCRNIRFKEKLSLLRLNLLISVEMLQVKFDKDHNIHGKMENKVYYMLSSVKYDNNNCNDTHVSGLFIKCPLFMFTI